MPVPEYYVPNVGDKVKFRTIHHYAQFDDIHEWAWLRVIAVSTEIKLEVLDGAKPTGQFVSVPLFATQFGRKCSFIRQPLAWEPVYKISVDGQAEKEKMESWLTDGHGIAIFRSAELGSCRTSYVRGDAVQNGEKPHWSMELLETIYDKDRVVITDWHSARDKLACLKLNAKVLAEKLHAGSLVHEKCRYLTQQARELYAHFIKVGASIELVAVGYGMLQRTKTKYEPVGVLEYRHTGESEKTATRSDADRRCIAIVPPPDFWSLGTVLREKLIRSFPYLRELQANGEFGETDLYCSHHPQHFAPDDYPFYWGIKEWDAGGGADDDVRDKPRPRMGFAWRTVDTNDLKIKGKDE